jgi:E3 Ubiquitin ligase
VPSQKGGAQDENHVISALALFIYSRNNGGWMWAAAGALIGVYLFYRGFGLLQRKRLILDTPTSKIRSASLGLVEVSGLAVGPYTMIAPVTGVPCYYFRAIAWRWQQRGKNSEWVKVADESLHVPFFLDDNTGRMLVNPQGAEMDIHRDFHEEFSASMFSGGLQVPPNISTFLARNSVLTDQKLKVEEYCIKPKNSLFILGTLTQNSGPSVTATPVRSVVSAQPTTSFHIAGFSGGISLGMGGSSSVAALFSPNTPKPQTPLSDSSAPSQTVADPSQQPKITAALVKAGINNAAAWAVAGVDPGVVATPVPSAGGSAAAPAVALEQFNLRPPVVLMKGAHDPAFFISWRSQREVVKSLGWKSTLMIWGGPVITLLCMYFIALHFDWL